MGKTHQRAVLAFPSGRQAMVDKNAPRKRNASTAKLRFRVRLCFKLFWDGFISPIFNAAAFFQFIAQALGLFALYVFLGPKKLTEISVNAAAAIASFAAAMVCWAIIQATAAPLRMRNAETSIGTWQGNRFVFNEPRRVLTTEWTPADNGSAKAIPVPDIEPGALVDYRIDVDGPASRLNCLVVGAYYFHPIAEVVQSTRFALSGRATLKRDRTLALRCFSQPDTVPAIVRVYILAWEIDHKVCLDYTDEPHGYRVVMAPPDTEHRPKTVQNG